MESGQLRIGYIHFAFLNEQSLLTAEASECAAEQDQFWAYHDYLFEVWDNTNPNTFSQENLRQYAADLDLDTTLFNECMDSGRMKAVVQQDTEFARQIGVSSTPTFALNGKPIRGALPFPQFQTAIEEELQKE